MREAIDDAFRKFSYIYRWRWHIQPRTIEAMVRYMNHLDSMMEEIYGDD